MQASIERGLKKEGVLPGSLQIKRHAKELYEARKMNRFSNDNKLLSAYAYAVNEENASGGIIATAPTCGASGSVPAVLYYLKKHCQISDQKILECLATAGMIGAVVKRNATISGAEAGCQAEVGVGTAMAAAAFAEAFDESLDVIEAAAEIGLEHQIGLTCDPVKGYVQVPCIQRNAVGATKAMQAYEIAQVTNTKNRVSFDTIVAVMYETGKDMNEKYRETALGGLAK